MNDKTPPEKVVVGNVYQLVTGLSDNQQLTISGNLAFGITADEMRAEFEKLLAVTKKLAMGHKIEAKKAEIASIEFQCSAMESDLKQADETVDTSKMTMAERVAEKNNKQNLIRNVRHLRSKIAGLKTDLDGMVAEAE